MYTPILSITLKGQSETFQLHPCTSVIPKYKTYPSTFQYISTMVTKRPIQSPSGLQSMVLHTAPGSCSTQPESSPQPPLSELHDKSVGGKNGKCLSNALGTIRLSQHQMH